MIPAIGYDDANQSHFTSRHYWEVGEVNPFGRIGWLGRYLDKHGANDNPLQGLSLDWSLAPALAASNVPVAAVSNPEYFSLDARDVWDGGVRTKLIDALAAQGGVATSDPELESARRAASRPSACAASWPASRAPTRRGRPRSPTRATTASPAGSRCSRRCSTWACRCRSSRSTPTAATTRTTTRTARCPTTSALFSQSLAAFQADLEARGLADRVLDQRLERVRAPAGGERQRHRPRRRRPLAVIGTRAKGTMVGEFPGLATLDEDDNLRHTTDFRAVYCSLLEQWMGVDAAGSSPAPRGFARPALVR